MSTRKDVYTRSYQVSHGAGSVLYDQIRHARHLANDGDFDGAMAVLDDVEIALHPALAEGGGGGGSIAREQVAFIGAETTNGQRWPWSEVDSVGTLTVTPGDPDTSIIEFSETGLWSVNLYADITTDGGNLTLLNVSLNHSGTHSMSQDAVWTPAPASIFEGMWAWVWWFDAGDDLRLSPGWALDGGTAHSTAQLRMVRLA